MSIVERVRSRTWQAVGAVKQLIGRVTGKRDLRTEGRVDRLVGSIRETGNEVRDWARTAARDARRRIANRRPVS